MGTAGHIDHGKTTLVKAITGVDCDRLSEEKKRGITIELGFAPLELPCGTRVSVIDVPGHERFVKNMVAGAATVDFVMLVISADEGVMPQTREHLEICSLLGITHGLVALTKTDMVDPELLELAVEDTAEFLQHTFLDGAPIVPVSSHTGDGLDTLRAEIETIAASYAPKRRSDLVRLPIDRVFSMKGHGTVVTGSLVSGTVEQAMEVQAYPAPTRAKVRTVQSHGAQVQRGPAGVRTALNLSGVEVESLSRGQVIATPGTLHPATTWDVQLTLLASSPRGLKHRKEVHFHHGTREILARIYLLDRDELAPGDSCVCQVRFPEPMVGVYGDRVVLRSFSPLRTIAGGVLVNPLAGRVKRHSDAVQQIAALADAEPADLVSRQLVLAANAGLTFSQLLVMTNLERGALDKVLAKLGGRDAHLFDKESRAYVAGTVADGLEEAAVAHVAAYHQRQPMQPGMARGELTSDWGRTLDPKLVHFVVERLLKQNRLASTGDRLHLPTHRVSLAGDQAKLREQLTTAYQQAGLTPPNFRALLEELDVTRDEVLPMFKLLAQENILVRVKDDMYFHRHALDSLTTQVRDWFANTTTSGDLSPAAFKDLTGLSRKYAIPLLEWLDKERVTVRVGDERRLRSV